MLLSIFALMFSLIPLLPLKLIGYHLLGDIFFNARAYDKKTITIVLFFIFSLSFLFSPFWVLFSNSFSRLFAFIIISCLGLSWSYLNGHKIIFPKLNYYRWPFLIILLIYLLISYAGLNIDLAWRGDEDLYIGKALLWCIYFLAAGLAVSWWHWLIGFFVLITTTLYKKLRKYRAYFVLIGGSLLLGIKGVPFFEEAFGYAVKVADNLLVYPTFTRWLTVIPLLIPFSAQTLLQESIFRLPAFLSVLLCGYYIFYKLQLKSLSLRVLFTLAVLTIPTLLFYNSILYWEPLLLLPMILVFFNIESLLKLPHHRLKGSLFWYALILLGFLKDTAFIFVLTVILLRGIVQLITLVKLIREEHFTDAIKKIKDEIIVCFSALLPIILYMFFRSFFEISESIGYRAYIFNYRNLIQPYCYWVFFRSFFEQFSIVFILSIPGFFILLFSKKKLQVIFCLLVLVLSMFFFLGDSLSWIGYARFNLVFLPLFLYLTIISINKFVVCFDKKYFLSLSAALIIIFIHLFFSPVNYDGSRCDSWGTLLDPTESSFYPYRKTIKWLADNQVVGPVALVGHRYHYRYDFYLKKYGSDLKIIDLVKKDLSTVSLKKELISDIHSLRKNQVPYVVFHNNYNFVRDILLADGYVLEKTFSNQVNNLELFVYQGR